MSLKLLVNNPDIWNAFLKELEVKISIHQKTLEGTDEPIHMYREQGAIRALKRLQKLRDDVNSRDDAAYSKKSKAV